MTNEELREAIVRAERLTLLFSGNSIPPDKITVIALLVLASGIAQRRRMAKATLVRLWGNLLKRQDAA